MIFKKKTNTEKNADTTIHHGEVQHSFISPEFVDYERGTGWYVMTSIISFAVIAFGLLTGAMTLVIAYLIFLAVYFLLHHSEPRMIEVAITQHGIRIDGVFISFDEVRSYWIHWQPPYQAELKLHLKRNLQPIATIHIFGQDPHALRTLLSPHVEEMKDRDDTLSNILSRALRL